MQGMVSEGRLIQLQNTNSTRAQPSQSGEYFMTEL